MAKVIEFGGALLGAVERDMELRELREAIELPTVQRALAKVVHEYPQPNERELARRFLVMRLPTVQRINDSMARVNGRPWTKGFVRGRDKRCEVGVCRRRLRSGDKSYRPIVEGDGVVRFMRLCVPCVEDPFGFAEGSTEVSDG